MKTCDICNRSESEFLKKGNSLKIALDANGLWLCEDCRSKMKHLPPVNHDDTELDEDLKQLVGKSAGAICRTLELPYQPPYQEILDAAARIAYDEDRYMSAWSFLTQWMDGTTVWQSEDRTTIAIIFPDGDIQLQQI